MLTDAEFKELAQETMITPADYMAVWEECIQRCQHGVVCVREDKGWTIYEPRKNDVGVTGVTWPDAVEKFARSLAGI